MYINLENNTDYEEVGFLDVIILQNDIKYLVVQNATKGTEYPILLIDLKTGESLNGFKNLKQLNKIIKNNDKICQDYYKTRCKKVIKSGNLELRLI